MKRKLKLQNMLSAFAASACLLIAMPAMAADDLTVQTTTGPVTGVVHKGINSWQGLPYAAPPVGPLRWQPPQPVKPWNTPVKANALASSCAQNADLGEFASAGGSEDCLYLNVYRPADIQNNSKKLPVFVWIHGGGLQVGQGGDYDPSKLVTQGKAVVVTLNYRLGLFGFLSTPALDAEGHDSGNYGLMDQQAALRWVQKNISAFGGDPANVTISGESSGGNSVMAHIAAPGSAGLFQHVVAMSGSGIMSRHPAFGAPRPLAVARETGTEFAKAVGCDASDAACLRAVPAKRILDVQPAYAMNEFIIDGKVLPIHPADAYKSDKINHVSLINGTNRDEGRFFVALPELLTEKTMQESDYPVWIGRQYGEALKLKVLAEYPLANYDNPSEAFAAAATDSMFSCPARAMNRTLADKIPVYAYEFSDRTAPSYVGPTTFPLLAAHTFELAYVFPGFHGASRTQLSLNPLQVKLSDSMVSYFVSMSKMASREKAWPRYSSRTDNYMTFALPEARMISGRFSDTHHCAFWDQQGLY
ncbi:carboxylesterase [Pantoea sp. ICBG 828]|uniref:carboxylesterase/lipase family protein n=1 Tax=unclassified Pantoea TaxID=2630326 RepID=UPI000CE5405E|nr:MULTISPECIES: carboxylesterase family protein [unclassified Pantoea]NIG36087.1 carboxylesterase family protein [Pantoea sp. Ap-959]PPC65564.1 carboxylesterase [Pantoea sp. ICBG 828]